MQSRFSILFSIYGMKNHKPNRRKCLEGRTLLWNQISAFGSSPILRYVQKECEPFDNVFWIRWAPNTRFKPLDFFGRLNMAMESIFKA